jgi:hypothetical protein
MAGEPTDAALLRRALENRLLDLHTALPGRVEKYDATKQVADVQPVVKKPTRDAAGTRTFVELPVIRNVPVVWPRAGGFSLHLPMTKGDHVLLVFSEWDHSQWRQTGATSKPAWLELHGLSFPYAVPGIGPNASPIAATDAPAGVAALNGPGDIRLGGTSADFLALAQKTQQALDDIVTWAKTHTHATAGTGTPSPPAEAALLEPDTDVATSKVKGE